MDDYRILHGDALTMLHTLPDASVHCCVTSPPYYGLRDYGTATWIGGDPVCDHRQQAIRIRRNLAEAANACDGGNRKADNRLDKDALGLPYRQSCGKCGAIRQDDQIGLEPTVDVYVARLVEVFEEVRRVLRDDGTLWLNLGDSYANDGKWGGETGGKQSYLPDNDRKRVGREKRITGLKPKDLIGIPWRMAFALQAAGWWLRADIIWSKLNPMPESVTDRPTKAHEYLFLLTKSKRYFYDAEAIKEPAAVRTGQEAIFERTGPASAHVLPGQTAAQHRSKRNGHNAFRGQGAEREGLNGPALREGRDTSETGTGPTRNCRSVWTIATRPYPEAHFATFPTEISRRAILAGTSEQGCCPACGSPWQRVTERRFTPQTDVRDPDKLPKASHKGLDASNGWSGTPRGMTAVTTTGWASSCACQPADPIPCTVIDPFAGSGTTLAVAVGLGRHAIGIELNASYIALAEARVAAVQRPLL